MSKRKSVSLVCPERASETDSTRPPKRIRLGYKCNLLDLSDEVLLRCLSFLNVHDLLRCENVCSQLSRLAQDNELWRQRYYQHFVRPRTRRLGNEKLSRLPARDPPSSNVVHNSVSQLRGKTQSSWRQKYKTKSNWTRGQARKSEITVGKNCHSPVLARAHDGLLYTVGREHGLRVWNRGAVLAMHDIREEPTALAIDVTHAITSIAVGLTNGSIQLFRYTGTDITAVSSRHANGNAVTSLALSLPFLMVLYNSSEIEILHLGDAVTGKPPVEVLTALQSEAKLSPASLSLRKTSRGLQAGIAYAFNRFNTGWCLGVQEIKLDLLGRLSANRSASNVDTPIRDTFQRFDRSEITTRSAYTISSQEHPHFMRPPNSLSYCGCYVLAGLPDNTLMVYNVTSTEDNLAISMGRRLWGHTSAVSAAEVNCTGKALSISANSDELRYWELEDVLSSKVLKKTSTMIQSLTRAIQSRGNGLGLALADIDQSGAFTRRWISFDDEQAIVVGVKAQTQVLSCYDFS